MAILTLPASVTRMSVIKPTPRSYAPLPAQSRNRPVPVFFAMVYRIPNPTMTPMANVASNTTVINAHARNADGRSRGELFRSMLRCRARVHISCVRVGVISRPSA